MRAAHTILLLGENPHDGGIAWCTTAAGGLLAAQFSGRLRAGGWQTSDACPSPGAASTDDASEPKPLEVGDLADAAVAADVPSSSDLLHPSAARCLH